jgi:hypothetical protein
MNDLIVLGIDPGWKTGAISLWKNNRCVYVRDMPISIESIIDYVKDLSTLYCPWYACIELIHAFPGFDIMSQEDLIRNHQTWLTLLQEYTKGFIQVSPVLWQNRILGKIDHSESDEYKNLAKAISEVKEANKDKTVKETKEILQKSLAKAKSMRKDEIKNASVLKAKEFYPDCIYEIIGPKGGVHRMDGRADAVNIGRYGCDYFNKELFK